MCRSMRPLAGVSGAAVVRRSLCASTAYSSTQRRGLMALLPCSSCGNLVSDLAQRCPRCNTTPGVGQPIPNTFVGSTTVLPAAHLVSRSLKRIWSAIPLAESRHKRFVVWALLFLLHGCSGWLAGWSPSYAALMAAISVGITYAIYCGWWYVDALDRAAARSRYVWGVRLGWMLVMVAAISLSRSPSAQADPAKRVIRPGDDISPPTTQDRFRPEVIVLVLGLYILEHSARGAAVREQTLRQQHALPTGTRNEGNI